MSTDRAQQRRCAQGRSHRDDVRTEPGSISMWSETNCVLGPASVFQRWQTTACRPLAAQLVTLQQVQCNRCYSHELT